jgi:uncharacterized membrane protein
LFAGLPIISLFLVGSAAFFGAGFFWFTIGKVYEITQEKRTRITWHFVWILSVLALGAYASGWFILLRGDQQGFVPLRAGVVLITLSFLFCRYGVYCYKTQTSIGARFAVKPDDQFWIGAEQ